MLYLPLHISLLKSWGHFNTGVQSFPSPFRLVDVRDVAYAHIQALEVPIASGRYLLIGRVTQLHEILKILHEHYPAFNIPEKYVLGLSQFYSFHFLQYKNFIVA